MKNRSRIGGVLVNYESKNDCQDLSEKLSEVCDQIVIVDNNSPSPELKLWTSQKHNIDYIDSGGNLGYAGGNNIGINYLWEESDLFFIANPDINVQNTKIIKKLSEHFRDDPDLGMVAPVLGDSAISNQHTDGPLIQLFHDLNAFRPLKSRNDRLVTRTWVLGCALMISKEMMADIGVFNDKFFMYGEDVEYCFRAREANWQIAIDPNCKIEHPGTNEFSDYGIYYRARNTVHLAKLRLGGLAPIFILLKQLIFI